MKKTVLLLSTFGFIVNGASAQITITTSDIATPTAALYQVNDTLQNSISIGSAGTNQTWNMAALTNDNTDTLNFLPYSFLPDPNYPAANLIVQQGSQPNYFYAVNSSSALGVIGNVGTFNFGGYPAAVSQRVTPAEKMAAFPETYTTNYVNNYRTHAKFYYGHPQTVGPFTVNVDSIREHSTVNKAVNFDAWGMLTTPLGTYDVIRSLETKVTHDTVDGFFAIGISAAAWHNAVYTSADSVATYTWWANGLGFSLVSAKMDSVGNVMHVQWLMEAPTTVGINEYSYLSAGNVYPNPAENEINFVVDAFKQKTINVYDITGRMMDAIDIVNNQTTINTSAYANGLYTYSISGKDNSTVTRGKFTIAK